MTAQQSFVKEAIAEDGSVGRALDAAAALVGGRAKFAQALGVRGSAVGNWKTRGVPIEHCPRIEALAQNRITRRDLRPNDYLLIWPELAEPGRLPEPLQVNGGSPLHTTAAQA